MSSAVFDRQRRLRMLRKGTTPPSSRGPFNYASQFSDSEADWKRLQSSEFAHLMKCRDPVQRAKLLQSPGYAAFEQKHLPAFAAHVARIAQPETQSQPMHRTLRDRCPTRMIGMFDSAAGFAARLGICAPPYAPSEEIRAKFRAFMTLVLANDLNRSTRARIGFEDEANHGEIFTRFLELMEEWFGLGDHGFDRAIAVC